MGELPEELAYGLIYYAIHKIPAFKYGKKDFEDCLVNCASAFVHHYRFDITERLRSQLGDYIRALGDFFAFLHSTASPGALLLLLLEGLGISAGYNNTKEKPPPNFTSLMPSGPEVVTNLYT